MTLDESVKGKRVELVSLNDKYSELKSGARGTCQFILKHSNHDVCEDQLSVQWDSGSTLLLLVGVDSFRYLTTDEVEKEEKQKVEARYHERLELLQEMVDSGKYHWAATQIRNMQKMLMMTISEMKEFSEQNPSTFTNHDYQKLENYANVHMMTMDDQGFEGFFHLENDMPKFVRIIDTE